MSTATAEIRDTVNRLIEVCLDGEQGFDAASEAVNDPDLKNKLLHYSRQRLEFAGELQRLLASLGEEPSLHGSTAGAMHRGWINLKKSLTGGSPHALLAECERGEESAAAAYRGAMEEPLPESIRHIIEMQYSGVLQAHAHMKALRDAAKAS
jgi:uncharacterized protein (TIGR02284 family)